MSPTELEAWLEDQLESAVEEAAVSTSRLVSRQIETRLPQRRQKTRRAVRHYSERNARGIRITVRLQFSRRYEARNTETESLFRRAWRNTRPRVADMFIGQLNNRLKRI